MELNRASDSSVAVSSGLLRSSEPINRTCSRPGSDGSSRTWAAVRSAPPIGNVLTPGSLTGGQSVAATGTIEADGKVGGIGGVRQKIVGAQRDGATLFLVPPDNCETALEAPVDEDEIAIVPAPTLEAAIDAVETHADDPDADLPRCTDES